jgi:hypothetical protein
VANFYVSTTGNDTTGTGTQLNPWRTIAFACGASSDVAAGDTIWVRGGTYAEGITIGKSGTTNAPITVRNFTGEAVNVTTGNANGIFYFGNRNNWTVHGFEISGATAGAGVFIEDGDDANQTTTIDGCHIHDCDSSDNASGIYGQRSVGTFIFQNCVLHDNFETAGHADNNASGIVWFGHNGIANSQPVTIRMLHNEVYEEGVGLKIKHPFNTAQTVIVEVAYNYVHDTYGRACIEMACSNDFAPTLTTNHTKRYHHNLCINSDANTGPGIKLGGDFGEWDALVDFNTFYNVNNGIQLHTEPGADSPHALRNTFRNNICVPAALTTGSNGAAVFFEIGNNTPINVFNYNAYWNLTPTTSVMYNGGLQTLASWQGTTAGTNQEANGPGRQNPLFVSSSDFHLQSGSPCRNAASNGNDLGCYELRTETMGPITAANEGTGQSGSSRVRMTRGMRRGGL